MAISTGNFPKSTQGTNKGNNKGMGKLGKVFARPPSDKTKTMGKKGNARGC